MGRVEKILFGFLVLMLTGVTAAGAYVVVEHATRCDRSHFSAAAWGGPHGRRNEMAHRLSECHWLDGLKAQEVRERLGKPEERYRPHRRGAGGAVVWTYDAGVSRGFMFDSYETLDVELFRGTVRRAHIEAIDD